MSKLITSPMRARALLLSAVSAAALLAGGQAAAQTADPAPAQAEAGSQEIIVTARKRSESLMKTPLAVTALDSTALEEASVASLDDVTSLVPNISITDNAGDSAGVGFAAIYIRGIGQNDSSNGIDPGVGIYIDGVYYGRTVGGVMDLPDIGQIEVLRGPQGTLFGKNTMGGAVLVTSKRPGPETGGEASVTVGSDSRLNLDFAGDWRISDAVGARLLVSRRQQDGYIPRPTAGGELGEEDATIARAKLEIKPSDKTDILLSGDYSVVKGSGAQVVNEIVLGGLAGLWNNLVGSSTGQSIDPSEASPDLTRNNGTSEHSNDLESWGASALFETDLSGVTLRSITGYRGFDSRVATDQDGQPAVFSANVYNNSSEQLSQEFNLLGSAFDGRLDWVAGIFYFNETADALQNTRVAVPLVQQEVFAETKTDSYAAFGEATFAFTEKLSVTGGLRVTREEKDFYTYILCTPGNYVTIVPECAPAAAGATGVFYKAPTRTDDSWDSVDPRVIVSYQATDDVLVYGSYSTGFKSGGFNTRSISATLSSVSVDPEELQAYEAGLKLNLADGRLNLRAAAFLYDYEQIQLTFSGAVITGVNETVLANIGTAEYKGGEIEAVWRPVTPLTLSASVGYLDAAYTDIDQDAASEIARLNNFSLSTDLKLPKAPEWTVNAGIEYVMPLIIGGDVSWRLDYAFQTKSYNDIYNGEGVSTPEHSLFNARITYRPEAIWTLALYGKNLTDERYVVNGYDAIKAGSSQNFVAVSEPLEVGATLTLDF